jgi:hypothetical protein
MIKKKQNGFWSAANMAFTPAERRAYNNWRDDLHLAAERVGWLVGVNVEHEDISEQARLDVNRLHCLVSQCPRMFKESRKGK